MATRKRVRPELTDDERAVKRAAERELMAEAVEALRSSEGWRRWLDLRRHFHNYSLHNQLLIAFQLPEATRVAGFRQWLKLGYAVRKGEHGLSIWAPYPPSKSALKKWRDAGSDPEKKPRTYFRLVKVFDRSQVDPPPEFPGGPVPLDPPSVPVEGDQLKTLIEPLGRFAAGLGYSVAVEPIAGSARGFCFPKDKQIVVETAGPGFSVDAQIAVLLHELAHALVRCDHRDDDPVLGRDDEEVVVECVAHTVCSSLGLDTSGASVPYVAGWGAGELIDRYAGLIDRLASRLEETAVPALDVEQERIPVAA